MDLLGPKSNKLYEHEDVNMVGIWNESYVSYSERFHGRME